MASGDGSGGAGAAGRTLTLALSSVARREAVELPDASVRLCCPGREPLAARLGLTPVTVGTEPSCSLVAADPRVSRLHCELRLEDEGVVLRDLGSKNGTFLGGARIREAWLTPGLEAQIGSSSLRIDVGSDPAEIPLHPEPQFGAALGMSLCMRALFARLARAATTSEPILLHGESGVGKEVLARAVHEASPRRERPFVVLDCGAIAPNLVESELFGHVKGAFTGTAGSRIGLFEQAHGGTLFLDEIGELPLDLQPKLLRALEQRQIRPVGGNEVRDVDARIVAATNRDLRGQISAGRFREDLFYRLAVMEATVPPLRDRREDIPLLVEAFLRRLDPPLDLTALPANALELLQGHRWPGNVRELRNTVSRLVLFPELGARAIHKAPSGPGSGASTLMTLPLREARERAADDFDKAYLEAWLQTCGGNVSQAAQGMGVSRQYLHRLMVRHDVRARRS